MKLQDDILAKYGADKALHFLVGALIVALASVAGLLFFRGTAHRRGSHGHPGHVHPLVLQGEEAGREIRRP